PLFPYTTLFRSAVQAPRLVHGKPERAQPLTHPLDLLGRRIVAHDDDHRDDSSFSRGGAPAAWAATSARPSTPAASPLRAPTGSRQARGLPMVSVGLAGRHIKKRSRTRADAQRHGRRVVARGVGATAGRGNGREKSEERCDERCCEFMALSSYRTCTVN